MKNAISLEEARTIMRSLVLAKGEDYKYTRPDGSGMCQYFDGGKPSCLIGHVFAVLGKEFVQEGEPARHVVRDAFPATPDYVIEALNEAQRLQDSGETWGTALQGFENVIKSEEEAAA